MVCIPYQFTTKYVYTVHVDNKETLKFKYIIWIR